MSQHSARGRAWRQLAKSVIAAAPWCAQCGSTADLTVDHVTPRAAGGTDTPDNLRVLCRPCNSSKGASHSQTLNQTERILGIRLG